MNDSNFNFLIGLVAIILTFGSCKERSYEQMLEQQKMKEDSLSNSIEGKTSKIPKNHFETIKYEGCEYLIYKEEPDNNSAMGFMAHKGNCSNPYHLKQISNKGL